MSIAYHHHTIIGFGKMQGKTRTSLHFENTENVLHIR